MPTTTTLTATFALDDLAGLARCLAAVLRPGDLLLLEGELGAGKTTMTRALASALGVDPSMVSSPTFALMHEYPTDAVGTVVHIDAYRLSGSPGSAAAELEQLGLTPALAAASVTIAEWPGRLEGAWDVLGLDPGSAVRVALDHAGADARDLTIDAPPAVSTRPAWPELAALLRSLAAADTAPPRRDTTCPATGRPVSASSPTWPFADERARMTDLYKWFSEGYQINRPMTEADLEQGE